MLSVFSFAGRLIFPLTERGCVFPPKMSMCYLIILFQAKLGSWNRLLSLVAVTRNRIRQIELDLIKFGVSYLEHNNAITFLSLYSSLGKQ